MLPKVHVSTLRLQPRSSRGCHPGITIVWLPFELFTQVILCMLGVARIIFPMTNWLGARDPLDAAYSEQSIKKTNLSLVQLGPSYLWLSFKRRPCLLLQPARGYHRYHSHQPCLLNSGRGNPRHSPEHHQLSNHQIRMMLLKRNPLYSITSHPSTQSTCPFHHRSAIYTSLRTSSPPWAT